MKVKILYVRNLMLTTTEERLREYFVQIVDSDPTCIERVKKINDYAFIHFKERDQALKCLQALNGESSPCFLWSTLRFALIIEF